MKAMATLAAAAALIAAAGCSRPGDGGHADSAAAANQVAGNGAGAKEPGGGNAAAPAADAGKLNAGGGAIAASSNDIALDRNYLLGRWTNYGEDCSKATELTADARYLPPSGGEALWNLDGDRLTITGDRTVTLRIVPVNRDTITVINEDGSLGRSIRC